VSTPPTYPTIAPPSTSERKLRRRLGRADWAITVVDRDDEHEYQPGFLFVLFGEYTSEQVVRSRQADMQHLEGDELYDEVEAIISASDFIEKTEGAQLLLI